MPPYINQELYPASIGKRLQGANRSFIRQIPLFRGLPPAQVNALLNQVESRFYQAGQTIIAQGAENRHIYFIQNGVSAVTYRESQFATPEHYAYLKENDIFGEAGIFAEGVHYATASVSAVTDVDLVVLPYQAFIDILTNYHPAALEVARILTERLTVTSDKLIREIEQQNLYLIIGVGDLSRATTLGSALVTTLGANESNHPVFTQFPNAKALADIYDFPQSAKTFHSMDGYDVYIPLGLPKLPTELQFNIILEELQEKYNRIVFVIQDRYLQDLNQLLEYVKAVILVATPQEWHKLENVSAELRNSPFLMTKEIIPIVTNNDADDELEEEGSSAHFVLPFLVGMPHVLPSNEDMPVAMRNLLNSLVNRLNSENEVKIYITGGDRSTSDQNAYDSAVLLERLLWFAKKSFGEVRVDLLVEKTAAPNGEKSNFSVISSYVDRHEINSNWLDILAEIGRIREDLTDQKIAVEIDHHLILV